MSVFLNKEKIKSFPIIHNSCGHLIIYKLHKMHHVFPLGTHQFYVSEFMRSPYNYLPDLLIRCTVRSLFLYVKLRDSHRKDRLHHRADTFWLWMFLPTHMADSPIRKSDNMSLIGLISCVACDQYCKVSVMTNGEKVKNTGKKYGNG